METVDATDSPILGSFSSFRGINVVVSQGGAADYLEMRSSQLSALLSIISSQDFEGWEDEIRATSKLLARDMAMEITQIIPLALKETHNAAVKLNTNF